MKDVCIEMLVTISPCILGSTYYKSPTNLFHKTISIKEHLANKVMGTETFQVKE